MASNFSYVVAVIFTLTLLFCFTLEFFFVDVNSSIILRRKRYLIVKEKHCQDPRLGTVRSHVKLNLTTCRLSTTKWFKTGSLTTTESPFTCRTTNTMRTTTKLIKTKPTKNTLIPTTTGTTTKYTTEISGNRTSNEYNKLSGSEATSDYNEHSTTTTIKTTATANIKEKKLKFIKPLKVIKANSKAHINNKINNMLYRSPLIQLHAFNLSALNKLNAALELLVLNTIKRHQSRNWKTLLGNPSNIPRIFYLGQKFAH
ncbi:hypothetical protein CHUAL_008040 [Chamberlinius hualienensis]